MATPYFYNMFRSSEIEDNLLIMADHLFITVAAFWMPYIFLSSFIYLLICSVIIIHVARNMTRPFVELYERIKLNTINNKKQKKDSNTDNKTRGTISWQIELFGGYQK